MKSERIKRGGYQTEKKKERKKTKKENCDMKSRKTQTRRARREMQATVDAR